MSTYLLHMVIPVLTTLSAVCAKLRFAFREVTREKGRQQPAPSEGSRHEHVVHEARPVSFRISG